MMFGAGIMHCCTANTAKAMYRVWESILDHADGRLRVNLLLNRASKWADISSHIPYKGQVDVKLKTDADLQIRIPEWVKPEETSCMVNGESRKLTFNGRYADVGLAKENDAVSMKFPISERTDTLHIQKERYDVLIRGNEIVDIDPVGRYCPIFNRKHYRVDDTRWRKIERFISTREFSW